MRGTKTTLRRVSGGKPVPLPALIRLRRFGGHANMLTFGTEGVVRDGTALTNPFLADRLGDRRFGDWTISAQAVNLLEREIQARPPRRVLEFGSGLSTACLARYMAENAPDAPRPSVVSLEQDADFCIETRKVVAELHLDELAAIDHAPLVQRVVAGRTVNVYDLPTSARSELDREPPDLVFIDGPGRTAGPFARWAVLHLAIQLLPHGFRFFLDDALRDSALESAQLWDEIPCVRIAGVSLVGHGVLVGEFVPPDRN